MFAVDGTEAEFLPYVTPGPLWSKRCYIRLKMTSENTPTAPVSLPKYLREGLPKQDVSTLEDAQAYIEELIEFQQRPVDPDDLPDGAEPVEDEDSDGKGTVVKEKVTCGDDSCHCSKNGEKHGPYKYRYYRDESGTLTSEYLGKA